MKKKISKIEYFLLISSTIIIIVNLWMHLFEYSVSTTPYLEVSMEVLPKVIEVTKNINDFDQINRASLTFKFKNNTSSQLKSVRVIIPNIGIGTLEWPNFTRQKPASWPWNDDIFELTDNINPEEEKIATISAYITKEGIYTIPATVETKNGILVEVTPVTLRGK